MKSLEDYLKLPYTIETKRESDGSYFIKVKELPGCMSVGESIEEAYAMIEDAKATWIQSCLDAGRMIPEPAEDDEKAYSGKFMVRVTPNLHRELSETANEYCVSLNHLVSEMLSQDNGIIKRLEKTIEHLLSKVSPVPAMTGEKRGAFEMPSISDQWVQRSPTSRMNSTSILFSQARKNRRNTTQ